MMHISIRTKLLILCVVLVLVTTAGISTAYYLLTKQDKQAESQQLIRIGFDIILNDFGRRINTYTDSVHKFLQENTTLLWAIYKYNLDTSDTGTLLFLFDHFADVAAELKQFGRVALADRVMLYGANKRLLVVYQRQGTLETMGGYLISQQEGARYLPMDDPSIQAEITFRRNNLAIHAMNKPLPNTPFPSGVNAQYDGEIPDAIAIHLFREEQQIGIRIAAPIFRRHVKIGMLVGEVFYTQRMIEEYASLSQTEVNFFAEHQFSIGTLPEQQWIDSATMRQAIGCQQIERGTSRIQAFPIAIGTQNYYQGQCRFERSDHTMLGAVTVSVSQAIEQEKIGKIMETVMMISGIGIVICLGLASWIVPKFTRPITTLTHAALRMAEGDLLQPIEPVGSDEFGTLARSFAFMREEIHQKIVELQQLNAALDQRVDERTAEAMRQKAMAEAANRAKTEFLANMNHELRTPLNVILGLAQVMTKNPAIPEEERENLAIIYRSGAHLLRLISNVLDLSKMEAGRMMLNEKPIDLWGLLDELENMFGLKAAQKTLSLTFERAEDVPQYICIDDTKLRQVLMNLLHNAVKFTQTGGVTLRVSVIDNAQLQFDITDTGPGMMPAEQAHLFKPFVQTETGRRAQEGTGLGLAISQQFVRLMGGEIRVTTESGCGATFTFAIPIKMAQRDDVSPGVHFVNDTLPTLPSHSPADEIVLTPTLLSLLPGDLYAELQRAIDAADPNQSLQIASHIHDAQPELADAIAALVKQFRFDILQAVFEENRT